MSYGQWVVDIDATIEEYGYSPETLTNGSKKPVICRCSSCGLKSYKRFRESNAKHRCQSIIDGKKKCFKCNERKSVDEFSKNQSTFDGYQKVCKECFSNYDSVKNGYKKKSIKLKTDLKTYLRNKISTIKKKCYESNIPFDFHQTFLYELYIKQNGKCYFTGIDIRHNPGCHQYDSISIERLNPILGYTKDNVVLAAFAINSFKGMMDENEFKKFLIQIIPKFQEYIK
jgi:hypothetical protein